MKMLQLEGIYLYLVIKILKHYKMKLKFSFLIIFLIISQTIISQTIISQTKKNTLQPYSISNIKLGMSIDEFKTIYKDSIISYQKNLSTETLLYDEIKINNHNAHHVMVVFYKSKLIQLYFRVCDNIFVHQGLKSKYGYNENEEYETTYEDQDVIIGVYGKFNDLYGFTHVDFGNCEGFIMTDKKKMQLSNKEGF